MRYCRVPTVSVLRLKTHGVQPSPGTLQALLTHCIAVGGAEHRPWMFDAGHQVPIAQDADPAHMERLLMTWAMQAKVDFSWLAQISSEGTTVQPPVNVEPGLNPMVKTAKRGRAKVPRPEPLSEGQPCKTEAVSVPVAPADLAEFEWREVQRYMFERLAWMHGDAIATLEASTGSGKTRVAASWICERLGDGGDPFIVAVPTVALASQWVAEFAQIDRNVQVLPVLGKKHYESERHQAQALEAAMHAKLVICTQHMLLTLVKMRRWRLVVDEAHLLSSAILASAGNYLPVQAMGEGFKTWCTKKLGLIEGLPMEVPLSGKMRDAVLARLGQKNACMDAVSLMVEADGSMGVAVSSRAAVKTALAQLWAACSCALLLSATESSVSSAGVRSIHPFGRRLGIPVQRLQDLGQIKSSWRDAGVKVRLPEAVRAGEEGLWLAPHSKRRNQWYEEVAHVIAAWSVERRKTLVLATSYADVLGIQKAVSAIKTPGVFAPGRETPMAEQRLAFATSAVWCWVATGAAWTGMDMPVPISRLAVSKLPLLHPEAMGEDVLPEQAIHDCVSRFRQGLGRMVRGEGYDQRELVLLDGRVNELSPWWKGVCHPYLQVLAEDYEDFERLGSVAIAQAA